MPTVVNRIPIGNPAVLLDHANGVIFKVPVFSITRSGTTATVKAYSHGLVTGSYTISGCVVADYNITATFTVTDADTLTYTVANSPATPAEYLGQIWLSDPTYGPIAYGASWVQIETPPSGTTLQVYKKIHPSASWVKDGSDYTNASQPTLVNFNPPMAMVQVKRSGGTGNGLAFWSR